MFCWLQVYRKVIQLEVYTYKLFFRFLSLMGYYRLLGRVACAVQSVLVNYFIYHSVSMLIPTL